MRKQLNYSRFRFQLQTVVLPLPLFPSCFPQLRYEAWVSLHFNSVYQKDVFLFLLRLKACYIMSTVGINVDFSRTRMCIRSRVISVLVFNGSPLLSFSDEVSPHMDWLPRKRKRGRTNLQHDWLLSPPSPLFISTTISGIFINPHGSMCLGVVKIDKWLIRIPPFYFPTD